MRRHFGPLLLPVMFGLAVVVVAFGGADVARAQSTIGNNIKTAPSLSPADLTALDTFIQGHAQNVATGNATARKDSRDRLIREAGIAGGATPASPAYVGAYTQLLNKQLLPIVSGKSNSNLARMNAAIAAAQVAKTTGNPQLAPVIQAAVEDASPEVALWGIKGATFILPTLVQANPKHPLLASIVAAVKKHDHGVSSGAIASAAYDALRMEIGSPARGALTDAQFSAVIPAIQDLLAVRRDRYLIGVAPDARADSQGTGFLTDKRNWGLQDETQKLRTMQLASDLVALAAKQLPTANRQDAPELVTVIRFIASAISVAASSSGENDVVAALQPAVALRPGVAATAVTAAVDPIAGALAKSAKFSKVTPAPAIQGTEPAPAPATAPTSGPTTSETSPVAAAGSTQPTR